MRCSLFASVFAFNFCCIFSFFQQCSCLCLISHCPKQVHFQLLQIMYIAVRSQGEVKKKIKLKILCAAVIIRMATLSITRLKRKEKTIKHRLALTTCYRLQTQAYIYILSKEVILTSIDDIQVTRSLPVSRLVYLDLEMHQYV